MTAHQHPDTATTTAPTTQQRPGLSRRATGWILAAVLLSTCLGALDQTVVATALPTIVGQLHGFDQLSWVITAYAIAAGVSTPLFGKLADMLGRRGLVVAALVTFLVGSLSAGAAQSMPELIAARAVQGFGAGGLMVLTLVVIADIVPLSQRGKLMGLYGLVLGMASLVGPVVGGLLTDHLGWRWAFLMNLPLGGLALTVVLVALRLPKRPTSRRVDALGFLTLSGAVLSMTLLTSWAGVRNAWGSATILGLAATASPDGSGQRPNRARDSGPDPSARGAPRPPDPPRAIARSGSPKRPRRLATSLAPTSDPSRAAARSAAARLAPNPNANRGSGSAALPITTPRRAGRCAGLLRWPRSTTWWAAGRNVGRYQAADRSVAFCAWPRVRLIKLLNRSAEAEASTSWRCSHLVHADLVPASVISSWRQKSSRWAPS